MARIRAKSRIRCPNDYTTEPHTHLPTCRVVHVITRKCSESEFLVMGRNVIRELLDVSRKKRTVYLYKMNLTRSLCMTGPMTDDRAQ